MCIFGWRQRYWFRSRSLALGQSSGSVAPFAPHRFGLRFGERLLEAAIFSQKTDCLVALHPAEESDPRVGGGRLRAEGLKRRFFYRGRQAFLFLAFSLDVFPGRGIFIFHAFAFRGFLSGHASLSCEAIFCLPSGTRESIIRAERGCIAEHRCEPPLISR